MVWVVAKRVKTKRGHRTYVKRYFDNWQEARVYQQDMFEKGCPLIIREEKYDKENRC
ncbi:hypothetical protein [Streptococcus ictaluri]|uniref:Uncharacterized protein n=1 Tax=Streptococcus dysgalactiae subsp. equisimilis TaxID=119602 RepID=A0AAE9QWL7_STREQ|nr:Uncharacterised protein [Streptococcus dysgalactiae]VTT23328.1 Uncharacterised protein [Streptococcus dysgalactiae subsp. equisimilis]